MTTTQLAPLTPQEERTWGMLAHLSCFVNYFTAIGGFIAALVIWALYKDRSAFVERQARESMNFQITLLIATAIAIPLCFVLIGIPLVMALTIVSIVFPILGGIRANAGADYRYPFILRLIPEPAVPAIPASPLEPPAPPPPPQS